MSEQFRGYLSLGPYAETLAGMRASLAAGEGMIKLVGEAGVGKSALCEELSWALEAEGFEVLLVTRPPADAAALEQLLRRRFSLNVNSNIHRALGDYLRRDGQSQLLAIILDDAQDLGDEVLQALRLLANIQDDSRGLVRVVLAGTPALDARLGNPAQRSLAQHINQSHTLGPLSREETEALSHALMVRMGLERHGLEDTAVKRLQRLSRGLPGPLFAMWNELLAFREILPPAITARTLRSLLDEPEDAPPALDPSTLALSLGAVLLAAVLGWWTVSYLQLSPAPALTETDTGAGAPRTDIQEEIRPLGETLPPEVSQPMAAGESADIAPALAAAGVKAEEAAEAAVTGPVIPPEETALAAFVRDWLDSWRRQDVDAYLSHYHPRFDSLYHDSREAWREDRGVRLEAPESISLAFDRFEVIQAEEDRATVRFWLYYDSPGYADETWKELRLRLEDGRWLILVERNLETHVLGA